MNKNNQHYYKIFTYIINEHDTLHEFFPPDNSHFNIKTRMTSFVTFTSSQREIFTSSPIGVRILIFPAMVKNSNFSILDLNLCVLLFFSNDWKTGLMNSIRWQKTWLYWNSQQGIQMVMGRFKRFISELFGGLALILLVNAQDQSGMII